MMNPATRLALKVGFATSFSILIALAVHLQDAYWVGISAFLICCEQVGNSVEKMVQRIVCTLVGAASGLLVVHFFMETPVLLSFISFLFMTITVYKGFKDDEWYIWIFTAITFFMVVATVFSSTSTLDVLNVAFYRSLDIVVGSIVGFVVNLLVFPVRSLAILEAKLPAFLDDFEAYYAVSVAGLFVNEHREARLLLEKKITIELPRLVAMKKAALQESILFERSRRVLIQHLDQMTMAVKEFLSVQQQIEGADLSYLRQFKKELVELKEAFRLFLRDPQGAAECVREKLAVLYAQYDATRRSGLNFNYDPEAVTVLHEWIGVHQLFFDLIKMVPEKNLRLYREKIKNWSRHFYQNRFYLWFGVKVGLGVLACPLLWVAFALPGATQIAVSMGAVLNLDFNASRQKSLMRVYGCFVGAALAVIALIVIRVESLAMLLALIFGVAFYCSKLHNSASRFAYLGTQAIVAFLMGVVVSFAPATIPDPAVERLVDIIGGVLFLYFILQYLWPFSEQELFSHYQGQIDQKLRYLADMTACYFKIADFDLILSMQEPIRLIKRDAGQFARLNVMESAPHALRESYLLRAKEVDQFEAFLVFLAMHYQALQAYESLIFETVDAFASVMGGQNSVVREKLNTALIGMRQQTLKGQFMDLDKVMVFGTFIRMAKGLL